MTRVYVLGVLVFPSEVSTILDCSMLESGVEQIRSFDASAGRRRSGSDGTLDFSLRIRPVNVTVEILIV